MPHCVHSYRSAWQLTLLLAACLCCSSCGGAAKAETGPKQVPPAAASSAPTKSIEIPSEDGLPIRADLYIAHPADAPFIVLFHQAGWSRGEYRETAPKLNALGFNCMAIDQRSGKAINGVSNQTAEKAEEKGLAHSHLDAMQDLRAALRFARDSYPDSKIIGWGSSYSASLVLLLAGEKPGLFDAVLAFSPGEYFKGRSVSSASAQLKVPAFVTSSKDEAKKWAPIFEAVPAPLRTHFVPTSKGNHGSRALWSKFADSADYWIAVTAFLNSQKAK